MYLGAHHAIGRAISRPQYDSQLRDGRLGIGIQQLSCLPDGSCPLCAVCRRYKEAGSIHQRDQRQVECVAEAYKACCLQSRVQSKALEQARNPALGSCPGSAADARRLAGARCAISARCPASSLGRWPVAMYTWNDHAMHDDVTCHTARAACLRNTCCKRC